MVRPSVLPWLAGILLLTGCEYQVTTTSGPTGSPTSGTTQPDLTAMPPDSLPPDSLPQEPSGGESSGPVAVTDATFQQLVLQSEQPVLLDCWAPWCGPCRMMEPALEELAHDFAGKAKVIKLNIDENPKTTEQLGITAIPALFVFKDGKVAQKFIGVQEKDTLAGALKATP